MKNRLLRHGISLSVLCLAGIASAAVEWPTHVTAAPSEKGKTTSLTGNLSSGSPMADLRWASLSNMACFPATQNERFRGNHVLYHSDLPAYSTMTITVIPKDPNADLSLYAYTIGTKNNATPPSVTSAVSCEAEYKWDRPKKGRTQDHTRSVKLVSKRNPYNVVIGVSAPRDTTAADYELKIDVQ
jgi:hypothetical protein